MKIPMKIARYAAALLLCGWICVLNTSCSIWEWGYRIQEEEYYSDENQFVSVSAVCVEVVTNDRTPSQYIINVEEMEYGETEDCKFVDCSFKANAANSAILKEAQIEEKLTPGTVFTFISAPGYFGDGYLCPIVGLEIEGDVLLDFETGYANLLDAYE